MNIFHLRHQTASEFRSMIMIKLVHSKLSLLSWPHPTRIGINSLPTPNQCLSYTDHSRLASCIQCTIFPRWSDFYSIARVDRRKRIVSAKAEVNHRTLRIWEVGSYSAEYTNSEGLGHVCCPKFDLSMEWQQRRGLWFTYCSNLLKLALNFNAKIVEIYCWH